MQRVGIRINLHYAFHIGSTNRATLLAFDGKERLCGEQAFAHVAGESTITMINSLLGKTLAELNQTDTTSMKHRKVAISEDESGRLTAEVSYGEGKKKLHITALMGMFLAQLKKRIHEETQDASEVFISLALPPNHKKNPSIERAYKEASTIAGIDMAKLFVADATDCLVATYTRKIAGLNPTERSHLEVPHCVLLRSSSLFLTLYVPLSFAILGKERVVAGHGPHSHHRWYENMIFYLLLILILTAVNIFFFSFFSAVVVQVENVTAAGPEISVRKVAVEHDEALGALHFDLLLFDHFASKCGGAKVSTFVVFVACFHLVGLT